MSNTAGVGRLYISKQQVYVAVMYFRNFSTQRNVGTEKAQVGRCFTEVCIEHTLSFLGVPKS